QEFDIGALDKARLAQSFAQCRHSPTPIWQTVYVRLRGPSKENTNNRQRLLRARCERPRRRRAAKERDELAPPNHSITSSAMASSVGGTSRPRAFAVCRLIRNSNLVAWRTGSSAGLTPLRMLPV